MRIRAGFHLAAAAPQDRDRWADVPGNGSATGRAKTMNEPRLFSKIIVMVLLAGVAGDRGTARFGAAIKEE